MSKKLILGPMLDNRNTEAKSKLFAYNILIEYRMNKNIPIELVEWAKSQLNKRNAAQFNVEATNNPSKKAA